MDRLRLLMVCLASASLLVMGRTNPVVWAMQTASNEIEIPFVLTDDNNLVVKAVLNGVDRLDLMLHTAASDVTLTEDAIQKLKSVQFTGTEKVESWGGRADSRFSKGNRVQLGDFRRDKILLWENKNSGKGTDGKFGLDFFKDRIVEVDFDHSRIVLHDTLPHKVETYERLKIENDNNQLLISRSCLLEGKEYSHRFLLHSGYSGGILIDDAFAAKAGVDGKIKIVEESVLNDSFGNAIQVKKGILPIFALGNAKISDVPVGYFAGSVGAQKISVIGSQVLKQFNLVFDIANNDLYFARRPA